MLDTHCLCAADSECLTLTAMALSGLGERLRQAREQRGLVRGEVAEKLDISERTLARWERGDFEPSLATLAVLADVYGVTPAQLIVGDTAA
jgi:transcriptional regulator with XRE-family HTH domain